MEQLHRNFGKLHTAQNKLDEALEDLSKDIYCSSLEVGPEHIDTSAGFFLIANIFYAQRKVGTMMCFRYYLVQKLQCKKSILNMFRDLTLSKTCAVDPQAAASISLSTSLQIPVSFRQLVYPV